MGKGYNNYMCKKPFHPGSKANIKRAWMAEQKTENEKKKQEELKVQYEKEQDLYNNRALLSTEGKEKLELNFMYEAPPGAKRERQKEDDEPEYKFEWQRKYNAPREDYAKGNADIKDQPFGIPVRNVRCIKCHKWGHINTDKECPLYSQASTSSMPTTSMDPIELMRQMKEDGFGLKENVLGHHLNPKAANQQLIPSDESDPEMDFLKSLSTAEKKKLLRKLKKLSKKQEKATHSKKKKSKKSKKSKSKDSSDSDGDVKRKRKKSKYLNESGTDSSSDESCLRERKHHVQLSPSSKAKKHSRTKTSSESESEDNTKKRKHSKLVKHQEELTKNSKDINQEYHTSPLPTQNQEHFRWINKNASVVKEESDVDQTKQSQRKISEKSKDGGMCKTNDAGKRSKHTIKTSKNADDEKRLKHSKSPENESKYSKSPEKWSKHSNSVERKAKKSKSPEIKSKHSSSPERKPRYSDSPDRKSKDSNSPTRKSNDSDSPVRKPKNFDIPERKSKPSKSPPKSEEVSESNKESEAVTKMQKIFHSDREESKGECKSVKRKADFHFTKQSDIKKRKGETSDSETDNKMHEDHPEHPDGFSHLCPQAKIDANYLQADEEYQGKVHDRFRHVNRDRRSPSVKQKYKK